MVKIHMCNFKTSLLVLAACLAFGNGQSKSQDAQSVPEFSNTAVLQQQCTFKNWQYRLHFGANGLPLNVAARDVLIKASDQGEVPWAERYGAGDIFVRDCGVEERTCWQAKAASLHFRIGPDGRPSDGSLMLVSAKRQLIVHRFNVVMEKPEDKCRSDQRS